MTYSRFKAVAVALLGTAGVATAEPIPPIPAATAIAGTTLCVVDGWEYAPRWSMPDNGFESPTLEDCATQCEADPVCTGATYIVSGAATNCWFKEWAGAIAPPCFPNPNKPLVYQAIIDPAGATCDTITYLDSPVYGCDEEAEIEELPGEMGAIAPVAAVADTPAAVTVTDVAELMTLDPPFTAVAGQDYSPVQTPVPTVGVVDLAGGEGLIVADAVECAMACGADATCNAASYYGDNPVDSWPGGENCYLKSLESCTVPADAPATGDATVFMVGGLPCIDGVLAPGAVMPEAGTGLALAPPAGAPGPVEPVLGFAPTPAVAPLGTDIGTRAFAPVPAAAAGPATTETATTGTDTDVVAAPTTTEATSGSMGLLQGATAVAATAVAAALML